MKLFHLNLLILIFLFSKNVFSQITTVNSGEIINKTILLTNFNNLKNRMISEKYFEDFDVLLNSDVIKSEELNNIIELFNLKLDSNIILFNKDESIQSNKVNDLFNNISNAIDNYRYISCKDLINKQSHLLNNDGNYNIHPDLINEENVYCDMTTDNGGWTRLSSNISTGNVSFESNGYQIRKRNNGVACTTYSVSVRMSNIKITDWNITRDDFIRTTITQCPKLNHTNGGTVGTGSNYYKDSNGNYQPIGTCGWAYQNGASPWDNNSSISMGTGEATHIRLIKDFISTRSKIEFTSRCSDSSDNGFVTHTFFVK